MHTREQENTLTAVKEWVRLRIEHEARASEETKLVWQQLLADIDHSALLPRLLDGKEALEKAPPRAYSYPWYSLVEDGKVEGGFEVYEEADSEQPKVIVIAQAPWSEIGRAHV